MDHFELKAIKMQQTQEKLLPLPYLPKRIQRACTRKRAITRNSFFYQKDLLITKHLLFSSFSEALSSAWKPQTPISFLISGWHIGLNCPICPWVPYLWVFCAYKINFSLVNLIYVHFIIRWAKDKNESFFMPPQYICGPVCSVTQLCLTPCDPTDSSPLGSSVHGILQARTLEWAAISSPGYSRHTMEY